MATATELLYKRHKSKDDTYPIVIRLINGKEQRFFNIGHKIEDKFWDGSRVTKKHPDYELINADIEHYLFKAKTYFSDCKRQGRPVNLDFVFSEVRSYNFLDYLRHRQQQHEEMGQVIMKRKVKRFIFELNECFGPTIYFSDITQDFLRRFEAYLKNPPQPKTGKKRKPNGDNTRHKKYEFLGKYYQNAVKEGMADEPNPFYAYKIPESPVKKEKLTRGQMTAIETLNLTGLTAMARDMFLFAYYCKGIRFETVLTMPKAAIQNGRLNYQINKGKRHMTAKIHPNLQAIIDRYIDNHTDTIFGRLNLEDYAAIPEEKVRNEKRINDIGSENTWVNRSLKVVAGLAGIPIELSFHHSRHTLAYHLKQVTNNIHVIQETLGHSKAQTTEVYLKELDDEFLDDHLDKLYQ